jgi:plastocyanin
MRFLIAPLAAFVAVALLAAGCGSSNTVTFSGQELHPQVITVPAGTTITWKNGNFGPNTVTSDNAKVPETALTSPPQPGAFNSGPIEPGASWSFTFSTPGTYHYHCLIDGYINGVVIVQ